ncbi:MAG: hypothetical protein QGH60_12110 [Phycisphaerae bacterium]|jgi:hypothetical protein|nr:hypothetical protein [Phycisphaerae bacterium]
MAQNNNGIKMLKARLMAEFARDKKKAVILVALLLIAVFFVGKMLLKSSPQAATAATDPAGVAFGGDPRNQGAGSAVVQTPGAKTPKADLPKGAASAITRDIFMPDPAIFPRVKETAGPNSKVGVVEDEKSKRDIELARKTKLIKEQGDKLHLESTITGRVPIAIINGTVLGVGGVINGFRVVKIDSQACVVEKEGVRLNLTME